MANQEPTDPEYSHELKRVYKEIDKFSNLLAPLREDSELIWNTGRRSRRTQNNSNEEKATAATTSSAKKKATASGKQSTGGQPDANWQEDTNAQLGYGEITSVS